MVGAKGGPSSINHLLRIKQESGDEDDELEDDPRQSILMASPLAASAPPMTIRETLHKLSQLLAESVAYANGDGDPAGAG